MLDVRRRCAQTARISLHSFSFQRARTQNTQHTRTSGVTAILPPGFRGFRHRFRSIPPPFPPPFRFGEGAFTHPPRDPQAENDGTMTIFSATDVSPFFSKGCLAGRVVAPYSLPASCVTLPPAIVSAIPVRPISSAGIASISPSISTRSAAIPLRITPVSPSIWAAHAPPAV